VLGNLVNNAITALRATTGPRALTIDARREGQDRVRIDVCDTGAGIDAAHLSRIFEPFFSTSSEGLGLGLAICKSIVAAHDGDIRASRRDNGETVFELVLPAAARRAGDTNQKQARCRGRTARAQPRLKLVSCDVFDGAQHEGGFHRPWPNGPGDGAADSRCGP
jgi:hypothetical protein